MTIAQLLNVKKGDTFNHAGCVYVATSDAKWSVPAHNRDWVRVFVEAKRANPAMSSGYECADVVEVGEYR